jgi:predicted nucleic acid-binding protein
MSDVVVLDACVLVPMPLCDTLLRLAEEPAMYRPLWSERILREVGDALEEKLKRSAFQRERRVLAMRGAFPEAEVSFPEDLAKGVTCIPDLNDRHVVAAAIFGAADIIVTLNKKHFPASCIEQHSLSCQTPDEFLVRLFSLDPELVLEKVDWQAATLGQERSFIVQQLRKMTPLYAGLLEKGFLATDG